MSRVARSQPEAFVALLRGVNVGRNMVRMADLRAMVEELGFADVRTVLNSGNVLFSAPRADAAKAATAIEAGIVRLGAKSRVFVLAVADLRRMLAANPLADIATDPSRLLIAVFADGAPPPRVAALLNQDWGEDRFVIAEGGVFLWCARGVLESPLAKAFGRAAGDVTTTRNLTTMTKLAAAS
ncbi:MAG TPA: DUF1697 domain-containing protein [Acetobacteraceae bacterium]|nr:DUF1697 domain-containing protein [Acetobacteraceae bacterium]